MNRKLNLKYIINAMSRESKLFFKTIEELQDNYFISKDLELLDPSLARDVYNYPSREPAIT